MSTGIMRLVMTMEQKLYEDTIAFLQKLQGSDAGGHDTAHVLRVARMAVHIAGEEHADLFLTEMSALLHDVDDRKLSPETAASHANASGFLQAHGIPAGPIIHIIEQVSWKGTDSVVPDSLEGRIVQDADRLDAIGAIGIARAFAYGGAHGRIMHDPAVRPLMDMDDRTYAGHVSTSLNHFYEKLLKLKDCMNTDAGRRIAAQRHAYMEAYLQEFLDEWDGRC